MAQQSRHQDYLRTSGTACVQALNLKSVEVIVLKGIGHGTISSFGIAAMRMLLDRQIILKLKSNVVDHDIPLIFGLEHHRELKCSSK